MRMLSQIISRKDLRIFLLIHFVFIVFAFYSFPSENEYKNNYAGFFFASSNAFSDSQNIYQFHSKGFIPGAKPSYSELCDTELNQIYMHNPAFELILRREEPLVSAWFQILTPPYIYPPLLAYLWHPISILGEEASAFLWKSMLCICLLFLPIGTARMFNGVFDINYITRYKLAVIALIPFWQIIQTNFYWGQINIFVLLLILGAYIFEGKYWFLSGFLLAFATLIKISPILFLLYFISQRNFKVLLSFIFSMICIVTICLYFGKTSDWMLFLRISQENISQAMIVRGLLNAGFDYNYAFKGFIARNFDSFQSMIPIIFLLNAFILVVVSLSSWYWKSKINGFLSVSLSALLLSPIIWQHHLLYLFPLYCYIIHGLYQNISEKRNSRTLIFSAIAFMALVPWREIPLQWIERMYEIRFLNSLNLYLLLLLFAFLTAGKFLNHDQVDSLGFRKTNTK